MTILTAGTHPIAVSARAVRKAFGPTLALDDVSFDIVAGRTHALLGENGAGKSTLVKLLSGLLAPSAGGFEIFGQAAKLDAPQAAHRFGIQTAYQELSTIKDLTVLDNMLLPSPPRFLGRIGRRAARRAVTEHLDSIGLGDIKPDAELRDLDLNERQKIEIARALFRRPRILLLDEPTSALAGRDIDWLDRLVADLKQTGMTTVFISHRMQEVRIFCDEVTVLRNGRHVRTAPLDAVSDNDLFSMIAGKDIAHAFGPKAPPPPAGKPVLSARGLGAGRRLQEANFNLCAGEILGVAGLQGMGQLELFCALFGMIEARGEIRVENRAVTFTSPRDAIEARIGISLVPEDRKCQALFLNLDGQQNAALPVGGRYTRFGLIDTTHEEQEVARVFGLLNVPMQALWMPLRAFSGGNQQKMAIAKWLLAQSRVLLLFDPCRGIDIPTKQEIYELIRQYAAQGGAVLLHSTETPELAHLSHRVMVLYGGRIAAELIGADLAEDSILRAMLGSAGGMAAA